MLDFLRKGAQSTAVKVLFAVIIIVFVFWGVGTFTTERVDLLAEVNGKEITVNEYQALYNFRYQQLRQMFGKDVTPEFLESINFRRQLLEELIRRKLFEEVAERLGLKVTEEEVRFAISQFPAFQEGGRFSLRRYRLVLRELGLLPKDFEESIRSDLLQARIMHYLTATVFAPEPEVRQRYEFENQLIKFSYREFLYSSCEKRVKVSEEELRKFYEENKERYRSKERLVLVYVEFPYERYEKRVSVSEEELKNYFEAHKEEFSDGNETQPFEKVKNKVREVVKKRKLRELLYDITDAFYEKAVLSGDLKEAAKKERLEFKEVRVTAEELGRLFGRREVAEAVLSLEEGEISFPLDTDEAMVVVQLKKRIPPKPLPFEKVKKRVREDFRREAAKDVCRSEAESLLKRLGKKDAKSVFFKGKVVTKEVKRKDLGTGHLPKVVAERLAGVAEPGLVKEVLCGRFGCYLIWVEAIERGDDSDWNEEKDMLRHVLTQEKRRAIFEAWYEELRKKAEVKLYKELP